MSSDPLLRSRVQGWRYELLTGAGVYLRNLNVVDMSLDLNIENTYYASGNIRRIAAQGEDWLNHLVRVWYQLEGVADRPVATLIPKVPGESHTSASVQIDVSLFDRTSVLDADIFGYTYGIPAGTVVTTKVREVISSTGDSFQNLITDSAAVLSADLTFGPNDSKLAVVNKLLSSIGYGKLWTDELGRWRADPDLDLKTAPITWDFTTERHGLFLPEFDRERNLADVPNRYICTRQVPGSTPADRAVATDTDPNSQFSYVNRGNRWITAPVEADVPAADFATLQTLTRQKLVKAQQVASELTISHPMLPFRAGDLVKFGHRRLGTTRAQVIRQTIPRRGLVKSVLKEVL